MGDEPSTASSAPAATSIRPDNALLSLTITNKSGVMQSYAMFTDLPAITPEVKPVFNDFIVSFPNVPGNGGQAFFTMPSAELHAICGTVDREALGDGVQLEILDKKAVTLGHTTDDQRLVPGSSCMVEVRNGGLAFSRTTSVAPVGNTGCFCIRTTTDFAYQEAMQGHYIIGFGVSTTPEMVKAIGPFVSFCPAPNTLYQIRPSNVFYVAIGHYAPRAETPEGLEGTSCKIDFGETPSRSVELIHDKYGKLYTVNKRARL